MARICEDFNLTPVLARAHYEQMARYLAGTAKCQPSRAGCAPWLSALRSHRASRSPPSARSRSASSWPPPCADKAGEHDEWAASGDPAELADLRFPCLLDSRSGEVKRSRPPVSRGRLSRSFVLAALRALHLDKPGVGAAPAHHDTPVIQLASIRGRRGPPSVPLLRTGPALSCAAKEYASKRVTPQAMRPASGRCLPDEGDLDVWISRCAHHAARAGCFRDPFTEFGVELHHPAFTKGRGV